MDLLWIKKIGLTGVAWVCLRTPGRTKPSAQRKDELGEPRYREAPAPSCGHSSCADPRQRLYCPSELLRVRQARGDMSWHSGAPVSAGWRPRQRAHRPASRPAARHDQAGPPNRRGRRRFRHPHSAYPLPAIVLVLAKIIQAAASWRPGR